MERDQRCKSPQSHGGAEEFDSQILRWSRRTHSLLNYLGYQLMGEQKIGDAIAIFQRISEGFCAEVLGSDVRGSGLRSLGPGVCFTSNCPGVSLW